MVIQCSACDTRFKIADDKVKPGGVKVRCSKCKEVFTVLPPADEQAAAAAAPAAETPAAEEPGGGDWGAINSTFSEESAAEAGSGLDDVDWGTLNSSASDAATEESTEATASTDFSFGDEEETTDSSDSFSFGDEEEETDSSDSFSFGDEEEEGAVSTDDFSFGDEEQASDNDSDTTEDAFSFGGDGDNSEADLGFDESLGAGAQDEFSFDDEPAADDADDFDWDGSSATDDGSGDFGFGETTKESDNLDFSSLEMSEEEPALEVETPPPAAAPALDEMPARETARPSSVKGPQKSGGKGRGAKSRRGTRKKSGPLRGVLSVILLLCLVLGGGLYGLQQLGFWSGNFEELPDVDYVSAGQTAWQKVLIQYHTLVGNEAALQPAGSITVTEMGGKYIENSKSGLVFVIEGTVRNDFTSSRSAIAVRGILYDASGAPVQQQKVYCGNSLDSNALRKEPLAALQARGTNEFGDSLSNLDVAPGALLPFSIVFGNLPDNLSEYNVEVTESAAGSKP